MIPLVGYADRLSVRPGGRIAFHLSNATGAPVTCRLVRVISADANPAGPGIKLAPIASDGLREIEPPAPRTTDRGSYALVPMRGRLASLGSFTITASVWPTRLGHGEQPILGWFDDVRKTGCTLVITADARLGVVVGHGGDAASHASPLRIAERVWQRVACRHDAAQSTIVLNVGDKEHTIRLGQPIAAAGGDRLVIAASPKASFDGKIEAPQLYARALSTAEIASAGAGAAAAGLVAAWDFAKEMQSARIVDTGPNALHGELVNSPARAMTGAKWTGREMCFRHAPEQYGAIHFHADDLDDCRWPATHDWTVPSALPSGSYALLAEAGGQSENIPFYVVPPKGKPTARIALLASTFTYTIYHNHTRPEWTRDPVWKAAWLEQAHTWPGAYPHNPGDHPDYGWSTYNFHADGSGIHTASWQRPMLNVRIGYITYPYPDIRGSGLRHYPADQHLISWLEAKGYAYDIITDQELNDEGVELLQSYRVVMTGSHPEYHTGAMLDALEAYRDGGGRLMYLGGNGFYWKVALNSEKPGQIEIRRAEGGIRAWAAEPGEYYNQYDGEYGGLWRRNGRPPQKLVGVGFTAQGNFVGSYYRVNEAARANPRVAWMLEGIREETLGDFGLSGHGAAGFELDRVDMRLGSPAHAVVIAASENHPPEAPWVLVPEEQLTHLTTIPGEPPKQLIRADLTFFETPNDGAVFSTGSITFCGSLPVNGFENNVSRLLKNVLDRFLDAAARFPLPG
jgi:N,N-dimethylformamidase